MVAKETARERLDRIESLLPVVLVEIEALRILFGLLLDADFHRHDGMSFEPLLFVIQDHLSDMLEELDPETDDVAEQIRLGAITSAMLIADRGESAVVDVEVDDAPLGGAANDD